MPYRFSSKEQGCLYKCHPVACVIRLIYDMEAESERKYEWGLVKSKPLCFVSSEKSQQCDRPHLLFKVKGKEGRNIPKIHIGITAEAKF